MKLHFQKSPLYLYIPVGEYDGFKTVMLFEDFDETFLNYNINCKKKKLDYFTEFLEIKNQTKTKIILRSKNFYLDFFYINNANNTK